MADEQTSSEQSPAAAPAGKDLAASKTAQGFALMLACYYLQAKYGLPPGATEAAAGAVAPAVQDASAQLYHSLGNLGHDLGAAWTVIGMLTRKTHINSILGFKLGGN